MRGSVRPMVKLLNSPFLNNLSFSEKLIIYHKQTQKRDTNDKLV